MPNTEQTSQGADGRKTIRLSVTLPTDVHDALEQIAERNGVSLAWVMRKAAEQYVEAEAPLFAGHLLGDRRSSETS